MKKLLKMKIETTSTTTTRITVKVLAMAANTGFSVRKICQAAIADTML